MRLFLCGDVMTGRGIDQALPHSSNPILYEPYIRDAREYVHLAEKANGPIPRPVGVDYIWADRFLNLKGSEVNFKVIILKPPTTSPERAGLAKEIHYRIHPGTIVRLSPPR